MEDYHVNPQFKMGAAPFKNQPSSSGGAVAPATLRMMGRQQQQQQLQQPPINQNYNYTTKQPTQPLMPPVSIPNGKNSNGESKSSASKPEIKQFHRKSLGDWDFLETVGAGSMGKVKLARHHQTNEICAIKIVNRATKAYLHKEQSLAPPKNENEMLERQKKLEKEISRDKRTIREASLGQVLYHPHICRLFEMCTMSNHFYMLFEYVSGGQLLDYIIQHGSLREHHARKFARGVASALQYLHANNIVHRDLKIENIMISTSGEIKIIDFGLSNVFDTRKQLHTFCGSLYFAAPELLKANPYIGPEVDIWSFGVVLYVLVCGKVPFDDENSSVLHEKIKQGKVEYPNHLSIEVISLLSKMLVVDPLKRANLTKVIEHPWMIRGYDFPPPSYLPKRSPMTPEIIDAHVIKEMYRLEFIDDIEETKKILIKIITEPEYLELSRQYWSIVDEHKNSISGNTSINSSNNNNNNYNLPDPTQAYHPLLSMYYLVSEMMARKLAKLQKRQATAAAAAMPLPPSTVTTSISPVTTYNQDQDKTPTDKIPSNPPNYRNNIPQQLRSPLQSNVKDPNKQQTNTTPAVKSTPSNTNGQGKPLQILVPPKLAMPEQAHTSPTTRKSSEQHENIQGTLIQDQGNNAYQQQAHQQQQQQSNSSPVETQDKLKSFGGILRRLSQRNRHPQQQSPSPLPQALQLDLNTELPKNSNNNNGINKKTHSRTVSEYAPNVSRYPTYGTYTANTNNVVITPPMRSASQRQRKQNELPALPPNAQTLVQEQREKQVEKDMMRLKVNDKHIGSSVESPRNANEENNLEPEDSDDNNNTLPPLNINKNRRYHPSARAKSVGHQRRESLKFMRPAVPASQDVDDHGFLENSDDNRSENVNNNSVENKDLNELTDEEILAEASKAPAGSMPSIDYPRSLFLKGFFSVQTTSSKPLPIVRYKIISVLKDLNIQFKEVKGGFICIKNFNKNDKPAMITTGHMDHKRQRSISRQGSIRQTQGQQPNIPMTPMGNNSTFPQELSMASIDDMNNVNADDILTTSIAQDVNNHMNNGMLKERSPIKFEIHIVKVRIVGLAGVHFKKVSGNTWLYKELASHVLKELNL
ncbi:hypothetical protein KAFR_0B02800 [Kazachstania africana CBS 2517]|uniref:non-specific serine/threonine protein kinase n=1 Tax=Kazachstania africana (strain ATCC 22294 / BCRC 22015 / CBS 2517 / CECT 1963 / NBRC 1671 / NRRL Y-8276) TaxID=1071382 RepID=H2AQC7_KAZAF|nr:hypothetical protein KAFR_0B02800 [Kazachstania africana CBS 2517]CCF56577.1 hypothetical protein KAFR_0B02800 [Kazachstania africana CBS 2517]